MQNLIHNLGKKRLEDLQLQNKRIMFNLDLENDEIHDLSDDEDTTEPTTDNLVKITLKKIKNNFNLNLYKYKTKVIERNNDINFYLNWHIDDCAIFKHNDTENKYNNEPLDETYSLFHKEKIPIYTMVIYLTSHDKDFYGGEFEFVDKVIKPQKYDVILFDSREVHRVRRLRSGIRKNILVKFYE